MPLRGVIFDMGGTLLHYNRDGKGWEDTEKIGARGVYQALDLAGYRLPPKDDALEQAWQFVFSVWIQLHDYDVADLKLHTQIVRLAAEWGIVGLPSNIINAAAQAYMTAIQGHVRPLEGARDVLEQLRADGWRVGLISNTLWPGAAHRRDLDRYDLTPFIEHFIFSADVETWKPDRAIFEMSLDALALAPDEAVYIGDSLYFDVYGAQNAGLRGIWIEQPRRFLPPGMDVTPDATIQRLADLPAVVDAWR